MSAALATEALVVVGRISALYGVRGWLRIHSATEPRANILRYKPWYLQRDGQWQPFEIAAGREQGKGVVAQLVGYNDRDVAATLLGATIAISRDQLPPLAADEYYWSDLIGLTVTTHDGITLGRVDHLIETGANDVLVVHGDRERLIPFLPGSVISAIDLTASTIEVVWDPDF